MLLDILDALIDIRGHITGDLRLCYAPGEIQQHIILQLIKFFCILQFFAFLNINIAELIGGFRIESAFYGASGRKCGRNDQDVLGIVKRLRFFCFIALGGMQGSYGSIFYVSVYLKISLNIDHIIK